MSINVVLGIYVALTSYGAYAVREFLGNEMYVVQLLHGSAYVPELIF